MSRSTHRLAAVTALVLFIVLAGTGAGYAYWSTAGTVSSKVAAGTIGITQTGFSSIAAAFTASKPTATAAVTVTNSGTVTAPFTLALGAQSANDLARAVDVWVWPVTSASACSATTAAQGTQVDWTTVPAQTGTLAASASAFYCVRASVAGADLADHQGGSMTATLALSSTLGSWVSSTTASAAQSIADTTAPSAPGAATTSRTSGYSTSLAWAAATDNVSVTGYDVYRDGVLISTVGSPTYSDEALSQGATYSYTITARDAAGNVSAASASTTVATLPVSSTTWYRVIGATSNRCIDASGASTADGTQIIIWDCHGATNQGWRFVPSSNGNYKVVSQSIPSSGWSIASENSANDGARVVLWNYLGATSQQWQIEQLSTGVYRFVVQGTGKCLDVQNDSVDNGTPLLQYSCNGSTAQSFTLAAN